MSLTRFEIKGPIDAAFTVRGQAIPLAQGDQIAILAAQTNTDRVAVSNAPLIFAGFGIRAPELKCSQLPRLGRSVDRQRSHWNAA